MFVSRRLRPWIVVFAWLAGVFTAFWYFELRPQSAFAAPGFAAIADARQSEAASTWFRTLAKTGALTVVHVYREGCDCNRYTDQHLAEIEARFRGQGVRIVRVERNGSSARGIPEWVSSLPAAFVFGANGALLYFGPYSDAAWCGRSGARVEGVIENALEGAPPGPAAMAAWGCFCSESST